MVSIRIREIRGSVERSSIQAVITPPLRTLTNGTLVLGSYLFGDTRGIYHQMSIWVTDECLSLRYDGNSFVDGILKSSSCPFKQCVIIMTFDHGTHTHIYIYISPCVYDLLNAKSQYL
ncbi:hypothetical protein RF11_11412 [Thelohanellus kitauei]|uniref:Uncharacterized protein n=1 Tax=Thelohanellus kitauei TaxID=669202 RepID=A0A0C2N165_THEKT|nr:hypothetical protein RF11_11412 [Thelohanellus kitauei]